MRVTTSFFVSALIRRYAAEGAFATVRRHGADEAGALFIIVDRLDGIADVYGPAMHSVFNDARPDERRFQRIETGVEMSAIAAIVARELKFDPDVWFIDIEDREGRVLFDVATD